jgi:peptidoglycan/xylan/chitin deacetylase (PgdA/CDA1 family)
LVRWPKGIKCPIVLSFDVDAELLWNVWLSKRPSFLDLSMGVYGPKVGLPRLLSILERQEVKATFFVPGWVAEKYPEEISKIVKKGHEIANHCYKHENNESVTSYDKERKIIERGSKALKNVTGQTPLGFRMGTSRNTRRILLDLGFLYDSSVMDSDEPHFIDNNTKGGGERLVELPVSFAFNDTSYFVFSFNNPSKPLLTPRLVYEVFQDEFDVLYDEQKYCMFMLHPEVIGRAARAAMLERTIQYIKERPGVWFATAKEVAETYTKFNS